MTIGRIDHDEDSTDCRLIPVLQLAEAVRTGASPCCTHQIVISSNQLHTVYDEITDLQFTSFSWSKKAGNERILLAQLTSFARNGNNYRQIIFCLLQSRFLTVISLIQGQKSFH
jgi:hypothetical protein